MIVEKGEWYVRRYFPAGYKDDKGRHVYIQVKRKCVPATPERASAISYAIVAESSSAKFEREKALTILEYMNLYMESKRVAVSRRTFDDNTAYVKLHIAKTSFSSLLTTDVTPRDVQRLYSAMEKDGRTPSVIHKLHKLLSAMFNQAVKWDDVTKNPCRGAILPKNTPKETNAFDTDQAKAFLAECRKTDNYIVFEFALETGMRPGEYLALTWKDIDLKNRTATVNKALVIHTGSFEIKEPKTKGSRRTVQFSEHLRSRLLTLPHTHSLVFPSANGKPQSRQNLNYRHFKPIIESIGLDPKEYSLYSLRHSSATLSVASGGNIKAIAERLGHTDLKMLLQIYSHVLADMRNDAADRLAGTLYGN